MAISRQLACLIGPTLIALGATEALNLDMFADQIAPVVSLDGTIPFVVGLALVRAHNLCMWKWSILIGFPKPDCGNPAESTWSGRSETELRCVRGRDGHCWPPPRTDPDVQNSRIRLLARVDDVKAK